MRSAPSTIRSSASVRSSRLTFSCSRRAASSAASLTRFARSAPTMPGVVEAMAPRLTSAASGTPRVWTRRIASRPARSGGGDDDAAVEPTRAQQRRVEDLRPVGRAEHDHAEPRVEPVHLGEDLVERLLALVVAAGDVRPAGGARAADRVELVDEDDRGSRLPWPARTGHARARRRRRRSSRRTPTPTSGRTARRPRRRRPARAASCRCRAAPLSSTPRGIRPPSFRYLSGFLRKSTISVSSSLASSMPATSSNVTRWSCALDAARARAAERHQPAGAAAGRGRASEQPHEQQQEQQRRAEAEDQARQERRAGVRRTGR